MSQKENVLFILNSPDHVLSAANRFDPNCEPRRDDILNHERAFTARKMCDNITIFIYLCFIQLSKYIMLHLFSICKYLYAYKSCMWRKPSNDEL